MTNRLPVTDPIVKFIFMVILPFNRTPSLDAPLIAGAPVEAEVMRACCVIGLSGTLGTGRRGLPGVPGVIIEVQTRWEFRIFEYFRVHDVMAHCRYSREFKATSGTARA
jgi:hypothetical protein